jgi:hypothetical protein
MYLYIDGNYYIMPLAISFFGLSSFYDISCASYLLSKNYHMDRDTPQGTADPTAVSFEGQMLFLSEPAPGLVLLHPLRSA